MTNTSAHDAQDVVDINDQLPYYFNILPEIINPNTVEIYASIDTLLTERGDEDLYTQIDHVLNGTDIENRDYVEDQIREIYINHSIAYIAENGINVKLSEIPIRVLYKLVMMIYILQTSTELYFNYNTFEDETSIDILYNLLEELSLSIDIGDLYSYIDFVDEQLIAYLKEHHVLEEISDIDIEDIRKRLKIFKTLYDSDRYGNKSIFTHWLTTHDKPGYTLEEFIVYLDKQEDIETMEYRSFVFWLAYLVLASKIDIHLYASKLYMLLDRYFIDNKRWILYREELNRILQQFFQRYNKSTENPS